MRLNDIFCYYLKLQDVNDFETLCDLMVSKKMYQSLDRDVASYICIKQEEHWFKPSDLEKECENFSINKRKI